MGWHRAIDEAGFAIRPGRFSHEWLDRLLQAIHELAPQPSRAGVRHALRPVPIAEFARRSERINFCATSSRAGCISISRGALRPVSQIELASCGIRSLLCRWRSRLEITGWGTGSVKQGIHEAHAPTNALHQVVALRVSFDDSTVENGPLRVLPALTRWSVLRDEAVHEPARDAAPLDCVVPRAGVVIMRPLLLPASSKSRWETLQTGAAYRVRGVRFHCETASASDCLGPL
jgi:hypothetical protein